MLHYSLSFVFAEPWVVEYLSRAARCNGATTFYYKQLYFHFPAVAYTGVNMTCHHAIRKHADISRRGVCRQFVTVKCEFFHASYFATFRFPAVDEYTITAVVVSIFMVGLPGVTTRRVIHFPAGFLPTYCKDFNTSL